MQYKYCIGRSFDPYQNLALEEALFQCVDGDTAILYLWQNDKTVVIGRNQDLGAECRVSELLACGGKPARRRSGGGAVYHDLGSLNYSVLCRAAALTDGEYYARLCAVLGRFGLAAACSGRNDIVAEGKKVSGNAQYVRGGICCRHGTFLVRTDPAAMERFLTPPPEKLARHHIQSVRSRVTGLVDCIPGLTVEALARALLAGFGASAPAEPCPEETVRRLTRFYAGDAWIYGGLE